jgi:hypothetical protein
VPGAAAAVAPRITEWPLPPLPLPPLPLPPLGGVPPLPSFAPPPLPIAPLAVPDGLLPEP